MYLFVESICICKDAVVGGLHVETEYGAAEGTHPCELVKVLQHDVEGLVTSPRETCHGTVVAVCLRAVVGIDIRNKVVEQYGIERSTVVAATGLVVTAAEGSLDIAAFHHHNHG